MNSAVHHYSDVSKNRFDLRYLEQSDKHSDMPDDANGCVKIDGRNTVRDFNFNTI